MATRKMTFSISEAVATDDALAARLKAEESMLARACEAANTSEDVRALEQEFDTISAGMAEPWTDASAR
jgi:hypothetical protein